MNKIRYKTGRMRETPSLSTWTLVERKKIREMRKAHVHSCVKKSNRSRDSYRKGCPIELFWKK
jgi:hypothetical protein